MYCLVYQPIVYVSVSNFLNILIDPIPIPSQMTGKDFHLVPSIGRGHKIEFEKDNWQKSHNGFWPNYIIFTFLIPLSNGIGM